MKIRSFFEKIRSFFTIFYVVVWSKIKENCELLAIIMLLLQFEVLGKSGKWAVIAYGYFFTHEFKKFQ